MCYLSSQRDHFGRYGLWKRCLNFVRLSLRRCCEVLTGFERFHWISKSTNPILSVKFFNTANNYARIVRMNSICAGFFTELDFRLFT